MFGSGLLLVFIGTLAETPATVAAMQGKANDLTMHCVVWIGIVLNVYGLYRMARAKWRNYAIALLGLLGIPGAALGLVITLWLKNRNTGSGETDNLGTPGDTMAKASRAKPLRRSV